MPEYSAELMTLAAYLYYEDGMTQEQVAHQLQMSRVAVTRLLKRAHQEGIVEVKINRVLPAQYEIERQFRKKFGLNTVKVVPTSYSLDDTLHAIGRVGADLLVNALKPNCRFGMAWSRTVSSIVNYLQMPNKNIGFTINELAGTHLVARVAPYGVSWRVAEKLGAKLESIPVPVLVQNEVAREAILQEESIRQALDNATKVDMAFVGLGDVSDDCSMVQTGYLSIEQMHELRAQGAVGDILMRYYDCEGHHVPTPLESRIISISWHDIKAIPNIIAMAAGIDKVDAITGALNGKIINGLITDIETAQAILWR
jgi:DNA-binding transcriptional regulator LsrR (DeoR family)